MIDAAELRGYWEIMPDRVTVGYQEQTALGTFATSVSVANAWWRSQGTSELAPSLGVVTAARRTWYFPKSAYASQPAIGDLITNPTSTIDPVAFTWTILDVGHAGALGAWELGTISLALQSDLRSTITFSRAGTERDSAGRPSPTYTAYASNIACRVQPEDGAAGEVFDRVTLPSRFTCFLAQRVAVRAKDRAVSGGVTYTVISSESPDRLDDVQRVTLETIL